MNAELKDGARLVVASGERRIMVTRAGGDLYATDARCPHYGLDLIDGGAVGTTVHCPGCAVGFDLKTGRSAASSLSLRTYPVYQSGDAIVVDLTE